MLIIGVLICTGPSGEGDNHGAEGARVFAIYENFPGKIMSVLLEHNYLFFLISNP